MKNQENVQEMTELEIGSDDVLFTCKFCGKSLVIDRRAVGMQITCPDCRERSIVPGTAENSDIATDETLQLTYEQRITALSSALQGSHDEIRRLTTHLQEVARRRKFLEQLRASQIRKFDLITEELNLMRASLARLTDIIKDSSDDSNSPFD
jgi:DNA-directed RNA polymerase subunit RPC12/RpoP